ncbi:MAG: DUF1489 family protein, partial [Pseudomonadota bacterium]
MPVNIVKLSVGSESLDDLARFQKMRLAHQRQYGDGRLLHVTRMVPKRQSEI